VNAATVFQLTTHDRLINRFIKNTEITFKLRMPAMTIITGKVIEQCVIVSYLRGFKMDCINKAAIDLMRENGRIGQSYFPELLGKWLCVNAGFGFKMLWGIIKNFVDEKTLSKISLHDEGSSKKALLDVIDAD
jgi:hypothetical protein